MSSPNGVMLRVLINRYHHSTSDAPLKYLPKEYVKKVMALNVITDDPTPLLKAPEEELSNIHYSWLLPGIRHFPEKLQSSLIGSLPSLHAQKIKNLIGVSHINDDTLIAPVRDFLLNKLLLQVKPQSILPIEYLPDNPVAFLSKKTKQELVEIIHFLGLYDLAESIRHIIDKTFLQKLYKCLSNKQKQFLRTCLHQQEKIVTPRMEMSLWHGDCRKLDQMLQRRGLLRLGKALCGLHQDFAWYVAHILDTGRGSILLNHYSTDIAPGVSSRLVQQLVNLTNFLNSKAGT